MSISGDGKKITSTQKPFVSYYNKDTKQVSYVDKNGQLQTFRPTAEGVVAVVHGPQPEFPGLWNDANGAPINNKNFDELSFVMDYCSNPNEAGIDPAIGQFMYEQYAPALQPDTDGGTDVTADEMRQIADNLRQNYSANGAEAMYLDAKDWMTEKFNSISNWWKGCQNN